MFHISGVKVVRLAARALGALFAASLAAACGGGGSSAPPPVQVPVVDVSAMQTDDGVRNCVVFPQPPDVDLTNVHVEVTLPPGAQVDFAMETPDRTVFLGQDGDVLEFAIPFVPAGEPVDPLTFVSPVPLPAEVHVEVTGQADDVPFEVEFDANPTPDIATLTDGTVLAGENGEGEFIVIAGTAVRIRTDPDDVPSGTPLTVEVPGPVDDPPSAPGTPWWCAAVKVDGLPPETTAEVFVPTREPMPPGLEVEVFEEASPGNVQLQDGTAVVSEDGQHIFIVSHGVLVELPGTEPWLRPQVATPNGTARVVVSSARCEGPVLASGQPATFSIVVSNVGTATAVGTTVVVTEANGPVDLVSLTGPPPVVGVVNEPLASLGAKASISLDPLEPGQCARITLLGQTGPVAAPGTGTLTVRASAGSTDSVFNCHFPFEPAP